ncbi:MAG: ParB/RepB/Spo0J family partition protein [Verrucomicrobiales bacterium]|nr:ParB/RepB/Spo0J family partition protein [Verrucomicrobiales bacterium]
MPELPKRGLGKGLNALIKTPSAVSLNAPVQTPSSPVDPVTGEQVMRVSLDQITPSPFQPRKRFNDEHLDELAESIREHGLIQPLVVRPVNGKFELIAGERRWRACTRLQLEKVPIVTRDASDKEVLEMALIENLQREDLDPIEEAEAYNRLAIEFGLKQEEIAKQVSKSRSDVSNTMRLLGLDRDVQLYVSQKHISRGHAKALLGVPNRPEQKMLADIIVKKKLTVRETEALVQEHVHGKSSTKPKGGSDDLGMPDKEDSYLKFVEDKLRGRYSTNVVINHKDKKGKIEIEYYGNEDLSRVLELMGVSLD